MRTVFGLPLSFIVAFVALVGAAIFLVLFVRSINRRATERMVHEFMAAFPGRCMLCSFHRQAEMHGAQMPPLGPHVCIENKSSPWPLPTATAGKWTRLD